MQRTFWHPVQAHGVKHINYLKKVFQTCTMVKLAVYQRKTFIFYMWQEYMHRNRARKSFLAYCQVIEV